MTAADVADHCGCSQDTVYRHWTDAPQLVDEEGNGSPSASTENVDPDPDPEPGDGEIEADGSTERSDSGAGDIAAGDLDQDDGQDDDGEDLEPDDDDAKTYECGGCGADLEYLQKNCAECGAQPAWSAIDG